MKPKLIKYYKKRLPQQIFPLPDSTIIYADGIDIPTRIGYKSLRGFIRILRQQNKKLKKLGCQVQFSIILPIKN